MTLPALPNPSSFLGVALVINRNRDGPRFVFHYPPHIVPAEDRHAEGSEDGVDEDDILLERAAAPMDGSSPYNLNVSEMLSWDQDHHIVLDSGTQIVPWEHVAGLPTKDLESILTPARAYHKTLFQISLDPLYFVSYPIHKPENGIWKKKGKKRENQQPHKNSDASKKDEDQPSPHEDPLDSDFGAREGEAAEEDNTDAKEKPEKPTLGAGKPQEESEDKVSSMTMFNLVFILNPRKHEAKHLIDTMYTNVIRKVNKAYKYVQQRSDFVWKESKKILSMKDKAREERRKMSVLWEEILHSSSLAASMQDLYDAISRNKIAALQLDTGEATVTHSVQIPVPFHIPDLPPLDREGDSRGLWITTANTFVGDSDAFEEPHYLDKNFALLLMDDDKKIIQELSSDPDETTLSMIEFVRHSKPTMSFHQVTQQTNNILTLGQVRKFAQHFIFWRRAIAIPPLHARDIYILSPNADMKALPRASVGWARQFPFAPALPNFLADLSAAPRPYKWFCPSKSLRPSYLQMLAWLMRGGWVAQLCTFAYVVVWPEILYEVEYALEAEVVAKAKRAQVAAVDDLEHESPDNAPSVARNRRGSGRSTDKMAGSVENLAASTSTLQHTGSVAGTALERSVGDLSSLSIGDEAQQSPLPSSPSTSVILRDASAPGSEVQSPTSAISHGRPHSQPTLAEQVAERARLERIADKLERELAEKATAHSRKAAPKPTNHPSVNKAPHLAHLTPHIILDAKKATGKESLYLSAIAKRLRERKTAAPPPSKSRKDKTKAQPGLGESSQRAASTAAVSAAAGKDGKASGEGRSIDWDEYVANMWPVFCKYFNGRCALERIALQEEMKRKDVWHLLTAMSEYLQTVRHW
jgi:nitrogen permease regulator 3-like protein